MHRCFKALELSIPRKTKAESSTLSDYKKSIYNLLRGRTVLRKMASPKKAEKNESSTDAIIQITDMPEKMRENTIRIVKEACSKHTSEKDIAFEVKTEMDNNYGQSWLCIVGKCYGSYVTSENGTYIYLYYKQLAFLIFKSA
ncbi:Dynein light chain 1, cytoplasmic [Trichinella nativa]|uniref:Dynein light chain n=1 Tax=Trichinella nativa TaxID=6335 RepID=A0A0V1L547_9BILA|nr:Dynein light chain 1, cytoplasmic [Trichinella nativa]